jgi:hypothetical protein
VEEVAMVEVGAGVSKVMDAIATVSLASHVSGELATTNSVSGMEAYSSRSETVTLDAERLIE